MCIFPDSLKHPPKHGALRARTSASAMPLLTAAPWLAAIPWGGNHPTGGGHSVGGWALRSQAFRFPLVVSRQRHVGVTQKAAALRDPPPKASEGGIFAQSESEDLQLAFQCISGWTMMLWRSQDEFEAGIHGYRRAPRAAAWFDLRSAYDVHLEVGDTRSHIAANIGTAQNFARKKQKTSRRTVGDSGLVDPE